MKNMGNMMKQAQKLQNKMLKMQEELAGKTVEASSGGGTEDCAAVAGIFSSGWEDDSPDEITAPQYAQGLVVSFTEWSHFGQFIIFSSIFNTPSGPSYPFWVFATMLSPHR